MVSPIICFGSLSMCISGTEATARGEQEAIRIHLATAPTEAQRVVRKQGARSEAAAFSDADRKMVGPSLLN